LCAGVPGDVAADADNALGRAANRPTPSAAAPPTSIRVQRGDI
jgi:hypothetical protein